MKILDFGLAIAAPRPAEANDVTSPAAITDAGTTVGTAAYMSPEQARGLTVDARTDLWSLGVVLYELATGVRPFDGPTNAVIFEAVLSRTPVPVRERNPTIPDGLERIVDRLLEKDRETRYQSAADVRADLKRVARDSAAGLVAAARREDIPRKTKSQRYALAGVAAAAVALATAGAVYLYFYSPRSPVAPPSEYVPLTNFNDSATAPALSPDGRMVTFIRGGPFFLSKGQIYVKLLPNGESLQLTNHAGLKLAPVFMPDGSRVAYTQLEGTESRESWNTWTVPVLGGQATRLLPNAASLTWLDEQRVLFSEIKPPGVHMGIVTATERRSDHREIYFPAHERAMAHYSWASPDTKWVLLVEMDRTAAWEPCRLVPFDGSSAGRKLGPPGACIAAAWSPDGRWMYLNAKAGGPKGRGGFHLWRQRFPNGAPEQLTFGPTDEEGLTVAPDGKALVTSIGMERRSIWMHDAGGERPLSSEAFTFEPRLSPDGKRVYYLMQQDATSSRELWSKDLASGKTERLLPGQSVRGFDISLDETEVAFTTESEAGESQIWLAPLDRRSAPRQIAAGADQCPLVQAASWSSVRSEKSRMRWSV